MSRVVIVAVLFCFMYARLNPIKKAEETTGNFEILPLQSVYE